MENLETAFLLMVVGMATVFVILLSRPLKSIFQRKILFYECFADFFQ